MGQSFADQYDPDKRVANIDEVTGQPTGTFTDTNPNSLTMKDGYTQMVDAYNQEQQSETKNSFLGSLANFGSADASEMMPTNGLQTNSMGGITLNPDGSLNYNNTQPQNLGFRSMVDMANNANNFNSQFASPGRFSGMGQVGPNKSNMNAPTIDRSNVMGRDLEADEGVQIVDGLTSPYTVRGQIANDLRSLMSLPGRARDGIMGSASALNEKLGDPAGYVSSKYGQAKDGIMGSAPMEFLRSLPTPGNMIMKAASFRNPLNPNASNYNIALANDLSMIKDPSNPYTESTSIGSDGKYNSGMLSGQNSVSGFGTNDPGKQMDKSISTTENTIANLSKQWSQLMKNNPAAYANKLAIHEARLQKKKEERAALEQARQASANALQASNRSRGTGGYQAGYTVVTL